MYSSLDERLAFAGADATDGLGQQPRQWRLEFGGCCSAGVEASPIAPAATATA